MTDKEGDELVQRLEELAKKKESEPPPELTNEVVINLAGMTPLQYAQRMPREAKKYKTPVKLLEKAVEAVRFEQEAEKLLELHWEVKPAEDPVDATQLFAEIETRILQHVVMPKDLAFVVALWVGQTWIHQHGTYSPILGVTSAERDSGKSTLMGVIAFLVRRSLLSVGVSAAALYRSIEKWNPTFVVDEADDTFVDNPDLRQVINSGWTRGQGVMRCDPDTNEPRRFPTFCPKAIALKGKRMPDTILSRTIIEPHHLHRDEAAPQKREGRPLPSPRRCPLCPDAQPARPVGAGLWRAPWPCPACPARRLHESDGVELAAHVCDRRQPG